MTDNQQIVAPTRSDRRAARKTAKVQARADAKAAAEAEEAFQAQLKAQDKAAKAQAKEANSPKARKAREAANRAVAGPCIERAKFFAIDLFENGYAARGGKHFCSRVLHVEITDNSVNKAAWAGKLDEGLMTVTVITEDWQWTKAEGAVTFIERRSANKIRAWWIRQQAKAQVPAPWRPPVV